jgi:beta-alanine degradation protein BauB
MKFKTKTVFAAAITTGIIAGAAIVRAQDLHTSVSRPASTFIFGPTGIKTEVGELKAAGAYGDFSKGMHGTFIKTPAHFVSPFHTHDSPHFR